MDGFAAGVPVMMMRRSKEEAKSWNVRVRAASGFLIFWLSSRMQPTRQVCRNSLMIGALDAMAS